MVEVMYMFSREYLSILLSLGIILSGKDHSLLIFLVSDGKKFLVRLCL